MKILFVLEHFYPYIGGAETLFYVLTTSLAKAGYEVVVVTTHFDKSLEQEEIHKGVKIVRIKCKNRFLFTFFSLPAILKNAKGSSVIHTTTYNAALPSLCAGIIRKKPVYITFHEVWGSLWKHLPFTSFLERNAFYYFEKLLLHLPFSKFIAVSKFTESKLIEHGVDAKKVVQIYNGINYKDYENAPHDPPALFTYTYFGRLGISKGLDLLIPAAAEFQKTHPDTRLKLIIPKVPKNTYHKIQQLIHVHSLEEYIEFHHNLSFEELQQELLSSSCVVIPSYSEGFCFAAAESVALGIPILSSQQGALQEVVSGKFIAVTQQNVQSYVDALAKAYQNKWTHSPIKYFDLSHSIQEYLQLYAQKGI